MLNKIHRSIVDWFKFSELGERFTIFYVFISPILAIMIWILATILDHLNIYTNFVFFVAIITPLYFISLLIVITYNLYLN
jgi:hypothetical protein